MEEQIGETTATSSSGSRNSESVFPDVNEVEGFFSWRGANDERRPDVSNFIHMHLGKLFADQYQCY